MNVRLLARRIRQSALLKDFEYIWDGLRKPYQWMLDPIGHGMRIRLANRLTVRIPSCYAGQNWEEYEPETISALIEWLQENPRSAVLDIGCAAGIFSLAALFVDHEGVVVGFDGDIASVAATKRLCAHAPNAARLSVVRGLIAERGSGATLADALEATRRDLKTTGATGDVGTTSYVMLGSSDADMLPHYSIDELFEKSDLLVGRPILLKCDVEGAELQVLKGASRLLSQHDITLLLSVHPETLHLYEADPGKIRDFLENRGYHVTVIAIDHEEHWFCTRTKRTSPVANPST